MDTRRNSENRSKRRPGPKSNPSPRSNLKTDPKVAAKSDPIRIAARATRRRRGARSETEAPLVEAEIVDEALDTDAAPLAGLDEIGGLPDGFARSRAGGEAGDGEPEAAPEVAEQATEDGTDGGALVPFDPLSRYLAEIRRFPILTREEEIEIAKRYQPVSRIARTLTGSSPPICDWWSKSPTNSRAPRSNLLDLIQEGNVGLMEAVKNFDPVPRHPLSVVRGMVGAGVYLSLPDQQLAAGEDRHHPGTAQALLQPAQGERPARGRRLRPAAASCSRSAWA